MVVKQWRSAQTVVYTVEYPAVEGTLRVQNSETDSRLVY